MDEHGAPAQSGGATRAGRAGKPLASELGGDLPCVRCRYNLRGLSVRAVCPECGTPVKATVLAVVDPRATELRPMRFPVFTAAGVLAWAFGALAAAACIWVLRVEAYLPAGTVPPWGERWLTRLIVAFAALSGAGAIALVAPHDGISWRGRALAVLGVVLYVPLLVTLSNIHLSIDAMLGDPYRGNPPDGVRLLQRLMAQAILVAITLALRPNARLLVARSMLLRTGRVDRQTLLALAAVLGVSMLGDLLLWFSIVSSGPIGDLLNQAGRLLVLIGSMLFTIGLLGVAVDCWRLRAVIVAPPLSLANVLGNDPEAASGQRSPERS
jgi:hypothetical protein